MKTLDLQEAAAFLRMDAEELRSRAKRGLIPGAKAGRRWVFLEADLAEFLRSLYPVKRRALQVPSSSQEGTWHYANAPGPGSSTSSRQTASEYAEALGLATKPKRKNSTTS